MKYMKVILRSLIGATLLLLAAAAGADGWAIYEAKAYGFSMLVPQGVAVREREWSGGWAGVSIQHEGVGLHGLAKLDTRASDEEIEKFAVRTIGIPASAWTQVDQGKNQRGWTRYYTFRATQGSKLVFGGYGAGPKGSYLLYLETTAADFNAYRADYDKWYESIKLN
jgi:hypothetical protein